ncbi:DUF6226 family protein [Micrococcus lacusdianchii]|uniref:DUF6226 family protein n=1 Tax=Micrococcus lacusdianchii TaxID=2915940 RepID=UPI00200686BD|nr:DUF6226 family protein [Micrococcus sp. JXJ CY 30]
MTSPADLRDAVALAHSRLDAPAWAPPHPHREPRAEEYERVSDPGRYRVVQLRARLWRDALVAAGARVTPVDVAPDVGTGADVGTGPVDRGVRLDPPTGAAGALPILLLEADVTVPEGVLPVVRISLSAPEDVWAALPDCGCDACDEGSEDLLQAIDATMLRLLGPAVSLRGGPRRPRGPDPRRPDTWTFHWTPGRTGSGLSGRAPVSFEDLGAAAERLMRGEEPDLPSGTEVTVGRAWFG